MEIDENTDSIKFVCITVVAMIIILAGVALMVTTPRKRAKNMRSTNMEKAS